jgi:hypothetical protein
MPTPEMYRLMAGHYSLPEVNGAGFVKCSAHEDRTPSLKLYSDGFYCFGCNRAGDNLDLIQLFLNIDFLEAVEIFESLTGHPVNRKAIKKKKWEKERLGYLVELKFNERLLHWVDIEIGTFGRSGYEKFHGPETTYFIDEYISFLTFTIIPSIWKAVNELKGKIDATTR